MDGQWEGVAARQWRAGQWLADGSLDAVAEMNHQCLEFLGAMAAGGSVGIGVGGAAEVPVSPVGPTAPWRDLAPAVRARLAGIPYLLADAGFDEETRWRSLALRMVHDLPAQLAEPAFVGAGAPDFIRRVLVFGWHMARANRQLARVVLGMSPACAERIAQLRLHDLDWLAAHRPGWVRPRWERQPRIWRHLLLAARDPDDGQLTQVSLRGLQLMATGVLGASAGVPPPRARRG